MCEERILPTPRLEGLITKGGRNGGAAPALQSPMRASGPLTDSMGTMETAQASVNGASQEAQPESGAAPRSVDWGNPRVEAILTAAAKCFARKGFNATTLAEIGKELGLRKSIVHYYFASKAALVQEVQSFSYQRVVSGIRAALSMTSASPLDEALRSLWAPLHGDDTTKGLNIEIWSAIRRDPEMRRRAAVLQSDARKLLEERFTSHVADPEAFAILTLAVLDGLAVAESVSGDQEATRAAFDAFVRLAESSAASSVNPTADSGRMASGRPEARSSAA